MLLYERKIINLVAQLADDELLVQYRYRYLVTGGKTCTCQPVAVEPYFRYGTIAAVCVAKLGKTVIAVHLQQACGRLQ